MITLGDVIVMPADEAAALDLDSPLWIAPRSGVFRLRPERGCYERAQFVRNSYDSVVLSDVRTGAAPSTGHGWNLTIVRKYVLARTLLHVAVNQSCYDCLETAGDLDRWPVIAQVSLNPDRRWLAKE